MIYGCVDSFSEQTVTGWAFSDNADRCVIVTVILNNQIVGIGTPQELRADVEKIYKCNPTVGFRIRLDEHMPADFGNVVVKAYEIDRNFGFSIPFHPAIGSRKLDSQKSFVEEVITNDRLINIPRKKPKAVLHIGMHKTGTTTIQNFLVKNTNQVFSFFDYAPFFEANHSVPLFSLFSNNPQNYFWHRHLGRSDQEIEDYNRSNFEILTDFLLSKNADKGTIFSGEDLIFLNEINLLVLKKFMEYFYERVNIIGYFRQPVSYFLSAFHEKVKNNYEFCQQERFSLKVSYREKFEKFFNVFESNCVSLFDYGKLEQGDIITDFIYRLEGKKIKKEELSLRYHASTKIFNTSSDARVTQLLFIYSRYAQGLGRESELSSAAMFHNYQKLGVWLRGLFRDDFVKLQASKSMINKIYQASCDDIRWMNEVCNLKLNEVFAIDQMRLGEKKEKIMEIDDPLDLLKLKDDTYFRLVKACGLYKSAEFSQFSHEQKLTETARLLSKVSRQL